MKTLIQYFKLALPVLITWSITAGSFLLLGALQWMKPGIWRYCLIISGTLSILYLAFRMFSDRRRADRIEECRFQIPDRTTEYPAAVCPSDEQRTVLIQYLENALSESIRHDEEERASEERYYSMWVHQIKTPIAALDLLTRNAKPELQTEMKMELLEIQQYVDMVLSYQRLKSTESDLSFRSTDLMNIVKSCIKPFSVFFIKNQIRLDLQDFSCNVLTDKKWLSFAISQIISNALKYTRPGGTISISLEKEEATLVISDTGIGIREEDLPRIFDQGFTGRNGRMYSKSTGIGLYLVRQTLTMLGHDISVTSKEGDGTTVRISFPDNLVH